VKDVFDPGVAHEITERIRALRPGTQPAWGKMDVGKMLAHCCVPYEMALEGKHPTAGRVARFFLKTFVKRGVVGEKPYRKNSPTAPAFKITDERDFERERDRLIEYVERTAELGGEHFDGLESPSFGPLTRLEWNNLFYKHIDHHLTQFGV
jgi:hypothetical protein